MEKKFNKQFFQSGFNKAKNFVGHAYKKTKNFLGDVNMGVNEARKIYDAVAPVIMKELGVGKDLHKNIMKGFDSYDNLRHKVSTTHDQVEDHVQNIKSKLQKSGSKLNFV